MQITFFFPKRLLQAEFHPKGEAQHICLLPPSDATFGTFWGEGILGFDRYPLPLLAESATANSAGSLAPFLYPPKPAQLESAARFVHAQ